MPVSEKFMYLGVGILPVLTLGVILAIYWKNQPAESISTRVRYILYAALFLGLIYGSIHWASINMERECRLISSH